MVPAKLALDRAMHMPAKNTLDLRVACDQRLQLLGPLLQAHTVHVTNPGGDRRMVHHQQHRPFPIVIERLRQPAQTLAAKRAPGPGPRSTCRAPARTRLRPRCDIEKKGIARLEIAVAERLRQRRPAGHDCRG